MASHWDRRMFPWDRITPRFYPPGQHPAQAREREALKKMEELEAVIPRGTNRNLDEAIDYARGRIAQFEQVESELKARVYYEVQEEGMNDTQDDL